MNLNPTLRGFDGIEMEVRGNKMIIRDATTAPHLVNDVRMETIPASILGPNARSLYKDYQTKNWEPYLAVHAVNEEKEDGSHYTSAQITAKVKDSKTSGTEWMPAFFSNPMQDLDYMMIEGILKTTFVGPAMTTLTRFIVGTGFHPELELINPSGDDKKDAKEIAKDQDIIMALNAVDRNLDRMDEGTLDVPFMDKVSMLIEDTNCFNRSAIVFAYDASDPFEYKGVAYPEIPVGLKVAHPRDLGIIEIDTNRWTLKSVQWRHAFDMVPLKSMIYLWNPLDSAKYHDSWFYGGSKVLPMMDAARTMRSIIGDDFPAMARSTWAGMPLITVKPHGQEDQEKIEEYERLAGRFVTGAPNFFLEDPENTRVDQISFQPKVEEFRKLIDSLARYCVACIGMPQTLFFDETTSTRSTMLGKIQLAMSVVINPIREQIGRQLSPQWYDRWFRLIFKDDERLKKYRIKTVFNDLHIEKWFDKVEAVNMVDKRKPLKDKEYGLLAGIEHYENKVDPEGELIPGGDPSLIEQRDGRDGKLELSKKELK